MKKGLFFVAFLGLFSIGSLHANDYGIPDNIQDANILHCFDWTFAQIQQELPAIAEAGFGAVQVSPVQGNCLTNAEWFYAYMPYDFKFKQNGNGSSAQLKNLCTEAAKYGIKIIVDVVANHVNQASGYHDTWWDSNGRVRWNGGINYGDRYSITHGQLGEYGDVNSEDSQVQARAKAFVQELKDLGVKGIRWDAAKHIGLPSESCNFWKEVTSVPGMYHYGEILDTPGGGNATNLMKEYASYMSVTDNTYSNQCREKGGVPSSASNWAGSIGANKIVYWGESHDDYSNDPSASRNISQEVIDRTYAIVACRNGSTALYFSRPSGQSKSAIRMGQKGSVQFKKNHIAEVNKFRNLMIGRAEYYSQNGSAASVTRKDGGAVIVRKDGQGSVSIANGGGYCPAGTYVDRVSGNKFTVTASTISGNVGASGIAVIYNDGTIPNPTPDPTPDPTPNPNPSGYYVYFNNTQNWDVRVWAWNDSENCCYASEWPGDPMTTKNGYLYWSAPQGKVPTMIIFSNNGGTKAGGGDLAFVNGAVYQPDGTCSEPLPEPDPVPGDYNVYYDNSATGWTTPYIYYWPMSSPEWPGVPMSYVGKNIWGYKVPTGTTGIIFNAGDGDASKSQDIDFVENHVFDKQGNHKLYEGSSSIQLVENEDYLPVEYFNLQGIRVSSDKLSSGVYIRRQGTTAKKIYVR